ncbi:NAD(+) synthase [Boudabousia tangfeifanii]|uniref:Glutamine-dependent NAD(+) synthetase n=1 Tax=Boudabousia tangfeifanii TaxID=1912795 RepID=A0A1D9ML16_9ACTO|nr:NAD(+) synthase [Boudabousia tangfeifanii]AOZ72982.1 NAD(+) synthase [Boudabousia tangfeifanii]
MHFNNIYRHGFVRVAAVTMPLVPAQPSKNAQTIIEIAKELHEKQVALAVFPELCMSGYAIDDLLLQDRLTNSVEDGLAQICAETKDLMPLLVIGAPVLINRRLYNCAVTIHQGEVLGITPKTYLPNYREFYEKRHFTSGHELRGPQYLERFAGTDEVLVGQLIFNCDNLPDFVLFNEICEDMWVPVPPSSAAALHGATILTNMSGSPITVGKSASRHLLCQSQSERCNAAYVYAAAGEGESTTDLSWDGQTMIYESGQLLAQSERFVTGVHYSLADIDVAKIAAEYRRNGSLDDNRRVLADLTSDEAGDNLRLPHSLVNFSLSVPEGEVPFLNPVDRFPFVPNDESQLAQDCYEAYSIQVHGLIKRLKAIGDAKVVIGVSGGLDSTHALIVAARAMDLMGRPRTDILAYTMPGFATSARTKSNAEKLCEGLGVSFETIDIRPAATQMLKDLGHPYHPGVTDDSVYDVTFENVQAGLRTDYLFRLANHLGGIVLGTGDLSELALGWCTYGVGDQMSHYGVNTGVPKTLIQHLIRWVVADRQFNDETNEVLLSILDTEISPELIPAKEGEKPQSTQDKIGPYALQDFNLFYLLRHGFEPSKILFLANSAWNQAEVGDWPRDYPQEDRIAYSPQEVYRWLRLFLWRFFANQFKRSALPNGPKVLAGGALSPRGDWRMPSDVSAHEWVAELDRAATELGLDVN